MTIYDSTVQSVVLYCHNHHNDGYGTAVFVVCTCVLTSKVQIHTRHLSHQQLKQLEMDPQAVHIKEEAPSLNIEVLEIESRIIALCQDHPKGITDVVIQNDMPHIEVKQRVMAMNRLLSQGRIEVFKLKNQLLYRLKDPEAARKVKGADNEEKLIYQIIQEASNKGVWTRDILRKSSLSQTIVNKVLKNLESKKFIKAVKSVAASKKKVYMLYNLEPDVTVTGGAWYSDQDFESEFVEVLNQQCLKFLQEKALVAKRHKDNLIAQKQASYALSKEIWKYISELGISKVQLSVADIETILNTLVYDGKVEKSLLVAGSAMSEEDDGNLNVYRAIEPLWHTATLMQVPCGVCPVIDQCSEHGEISPSTCVYMKEWLEY